MPDDLGLPPLVLPRDQDGLLRLGPWVDGIVAALALNDRASYALRLCLEESVANIVMHGIPNPGPGREDVRVEVHASVDTLTLVIEDGCAPFDPLRAAAPGDPTLALSGPVGGQGIALMRHFAAALRYERVGQTNRLHVTLARS